jgi:hypothetical protein
VSGPRRIRLSRRKGWRMPAGAVKVDRSTPWGNPFRVGLAACGCRSAGECDHNVFNRETAAEAVAAFRDRARSPRRTARIRAALRGRDLACWCALCPAHADGLPLGVSCDACAPCHADVLLAVANSGADAVARGGAGSPLIPSSRPAAPGGDWPSPTGGEGGGP